MSHPSFRTSAALAFALLSVVAGAVELRAQPAPASDLDRFMDKVLARREVNRKALNDYVVDEVESFEILGPSRMPISRTKREYTWYVRDGMHVRSPVRFNGVAVGEAARDEYERDWIRREKGRQEREAKRSITVGGGGVDADLGPGAMPTEPRFVSEAYFMDFKFEPGNYLLAGRETLEGHDVLRVEYYPTRLFSDHDEEREKRRGNEQNPRNRRERDDDRDIERRMNKTALVTLWIDPREHQIVKYTFDNVWLDFLPGAWLVRVDDVRASMTMSQPFAGVWLPRDIKIHAGLTLASGSFEVALARAFSGYREAQVTTTIKVPQTSDRDDYQFPPHDTRPRRVSEPEHSSDRVNGPHGPSAADEETPPDAPEIVREVRVHGNAFVPDADVLAIAGVAVGSPVGQASVAEIQKRLKDSGLFETVEVRKRYRSLTDPSDVALVLVVHERPGVRSADAPANPVLGPLRRLRSQTMFLPIVSYADGYGLTYGARVSTVDLLGAGERLSVPLTWGGTKRAAVEFERAFDGGPFTRVTSSVALWNRENPRFDTDEQRVEFRAGAERAFARVVRFGVDASRSSVDFDTLDDRQWTLGATAALDTRGDPSFPANAVYVGGGWTGLHVNGDRRINRYTADGRGYLRVAGQSVLAARAQYFTSDAALPPYERLLLGGSATLRGFRAGAFDGDRMLVTSAELRVPLTSVIRGARFGVTVFADAARVTDRGVRLGDTDWRRGAGAGAFMIASVLRLNLDVARGFDGAGTRVHLASGFAF